MAQVNLPDLPSPVIKEIFSYLPYDELGGASLICSSISAVVRDPQSQAVFLPRRISMDKVCASVRRVSIGNAEDQFQICFYKPKLIENRVAHTVRSLVLDEAEMQKAVANHVIETYFLQSAQMQSGDIEPLNEFVFLHCYSSLGWHLVKLSGRSEGLEFDDHEAIVLQDVGNITSENFISFVLSYDFALQDFIDFCRFEFGDGAYQLSIFHMDDFRSALDSYLAKRSFLPDVSFLDLFYLYKVTLKVHFGLNDKAYDFEDHFLDFIIDHEHPSLPSEETQPHQKYILEQIDERKTQ